MCFFNRGNPRIEALFLKQLRYCFLVPGLYHQREPLQTRFAAGRRYAPFTPAYSRLLREKSSGFSSIHLLERSAIVFPRAPDFAQPIFGTCRASYIATDHKRRCRLQVAHSIPLEEVPEHLFVEARIAAVNALTTALEEPSIIHRWHADIRRLNLPAAGLKILTGANLRAALKWLRYVTPLALGKKAAQVGGHLAAAGVTIEQTLIALALLIDECLRHAPGCQNSAVVRLESTLSAMLAAGYSKHWSAALHRASEDRADLRRRLLNASGSVIEVYEMERRRFSHDLHDEIGQDLMLLKLYLEVLHRDRARLGPREIGKKLEESLAVAQHAIQSTRRLVLDLGPAILDELGFLPALRSCARQFSESTGIRIDFKEGALPDEIPAGLQVGLYRVLQGALGNVFQHSRAANVAIEVGSCEGSLRLKVEDDGVGFDVAAPRKAASVGLSAMRERIEVLGGSFHIQSRRRSSKKRPHGTVIHAEVPLPQGWAAPRVKRMGAS